MEIPEHVEAQVAYGALFVANPSGGIVNCLGLRAQESPGGENEPCPISQ